MRFAQLVSACALLLATVVADCGSLDVAGDETYVRGAAPHTSPAVAARSSLDATNASTSTTAATETDEANADAGSSSGGGAFVISIPDDTAAPSTEAPTATTQTPTASAPASTEPASMESASSSGATTEQSIESSASTASSSSSTSTTGTSQIDSATSSSDDHSAQSSLGSTVEDSDASIAIASPDSSTFQLVESHNCSDAVVDNVYELYANCRSAFDLCVSASDYQIFPYPGEHPTQAQIQAMAESDACNAVFIIVIEANISACTIGGMPLISAVETLLKISVDLDDVENQAPSADVFQELLRWRYEVDLAQAAGVPYDGESELYAEFEANINAALANTSIVVQDDLSVVVRLTNGSYESFEDALDLVITDASTDATPGYIKAGSVDVDSASASSESAAGVVSESSSALPGCIFSVWSFVVAVVASAVVLESTRWEM